MKRTCIGLVVLFAGMHAFSSPALGVVGFRVNGGYGYIRYGDYNDRIDYLNTEYFPSMSIAGTLDDFHWIPEVSGEVLIPLLPRIDVGLGFGYLSGTRTFSIEPVGYGYKHALEAYPITASVYVDLPAPFFVVHPYLFAGGGAYYSRIGFDYSTPSTATSFDTDLSAWGFGARAGAGLRLPVAPRLSVTFTITGRLASIHGFEGTKTWGGGRTEDVFLASGRDSGGVLIYEPRPVSDKSAFGEGKVDLGGVVFAVGVALAL
jgi:hypothetical protein